MKQKFAFHHVDVRCSTSRGIQYSCMYLVLVSWILHRSLHWGKFDLDGITGKWISYLNLLANLDTWV